jgi:HEPN domain-containing protein
MKPMGDSRHEEWLRQAEYDLGTAEFMIRGGRYFYAAFMCHLAIEKALKGLFVFRLHKTPPRTHNLVFLVTEIGLRPPEDVGRTMVNLNQAQMVTRYPDSLASLQADFTGPVAQEILTKTRQVQEWIKQQF